MALQAHQFRTPCLQVLTALKTSWRNFEFADPHLRSDGEVVLAALAAAPAGEVRRLSQWFCVAD